MNGRVHWRKAVALAPLLAGLAGVTAAQADEVTPKGGPLVALILKPILDRVADRLADGASDRVSSGMGDLFSRFFGASKDAKAAEAAASAAAPLAVAPALPGVAPSLIYAVERLDPERFTTLAQLEVARSRPVLRTGDTFALRFATNLPGQVRIENVDAQGVRTALGTYNVLPGQDNRIPRTKGIRLAGSTGLETFHLDFYPCLPAEAVQWRGHAAYKDALPACSTSDSVFEPPTSVQVASRGVRTRAAVNLELDDPRIVVAALTDFSPRDIVRQTFTLQHDPR